MPTAFSWRSYACKSYKELVSWRFCPMKRKELQNILTFKSKRPSLAYQHISHISGTIFRSYSVQRNNSVLHPEETNVIIPQMQTKLMQSVRHVVISINRRRLGLNEPTRLLASGPFYWPEINMTGWTSSGNQSFRQLSQERGRGLEKRRIIIIIKKEAGPHLRPRSHKKVRRSLSEITYRDLPNPTQFRRSSTPASRMSAH